VRGFSYQAFYLRVRLAYAAHRLLHTDGTVEKIASEAGFADISHLSRAFAKYYHCTPGEYRNRQGKAARRL